MIWYNLTADEALKALDVDQKLGLTDTEVDKRFAESGANELAQEQKASVLHLLLKELKNPLILILIVGAFLW
jgi:Ca2+-transporting ATPase